MEQTLEPTKDIEIAVDDQLLTGIYKMAHRQLYLVENGLSVKVVNVNMPFGAMVGLMVKIAIASIPAMLIFAFIMFMASCAFLAMFASSLGSLSGN